MRLLFAGLGVPLVALALALPASAAAKASPAQACQAAQLAAAGRLLDAELECSARYYKDPDADPGAATRLPECRARAEEEFAASYQNSLDEAGPNVCALDDPVDEVVAARRAEADALVLGISGAFADTGKDERTLHAALLDATGAALAGALGVESKNAKKADEPKRLSGRSKSRARLLSSFDKALVKAAGVTYTGSSGPAVADQVDAITDALVALTAPIVSSVSGTVTAAGGSVADSDVNDPNAPPVSNDTPGTAQVVPVPGVVGGYVNRPGAGPEGNSHDAGDLADFFLVSLVAGQRVNLRFADPQHADLDLCLFAAANPQTPLDCSEGLAETEELTAPSSGAFLVEVYPFALCQCGSSYVLTLGQSLASAGPNGVRLSDEFVPGELVVTLAPQAAQLGTGAPAPAAAFAAGVGLEARGGASDREMLLRLPAAPAERAAAFAALGAETDAAAEAKFAGLSAERRAKHDTLVASKALRRRPDVALAEPNYIRRAQAVPNDTYFGLQWHYPLINLPAAWDLTTGSASVEVAVIDTGVLFGHPDLQGQLSSTFDYDFVSDPSQALDGDGIDDDAEDPGDGGGIQPSSFHGTHVAGTIGARTNNGAGVAGVAWNVTLIPLRALGLFGSGTSYDVLQAVRYAAGLANDSGTSHLVDVINLSLGGGGFSQTEQDVYNQAHANGVIVVAAAGNSNSSQLSYPASYAGVTSVSAVDLRRQKAPYSNFGSAVDVAAPGGDTSVDRNGDGYADGVLSTLKDESSGAFGYVFYQGTSMATPHVAGVAALMRAVNPGLTPTVFDSLLASGALTTDLGPAGRDDTFGYGLIDARKAVEAAGATAPDTPILVVNPAGLNLGVSQTQASFQVSNGGGGSLTVNGVTDDQPWLTVSGSGLGTYQVSVDRSGLANGTYTGTIDVASSAGSASVSVVMAVVAGNPSANAGFTYVLLIDPNTRETVAQFDAAAVAGEYPYELGSVPSGTYLLYAGSDADNDFFICGTGEACGAYPTLGSPSLIEVNGDLANLDFVSGFLQTLGSAAAGAGGEPGLRLHRLRERQLGP